MSDIVENTLNEILAVVTEEPNCVTDEPNCVTDVEDLNCVTEEPKCVTEEVKCVTEEVKCVTEEPKCVTEEPKCVTEVENCVTDVEDPNCVTDEPKCVTEVENCVTEEVKPDNTPINQPILLFSQILETYLEESSVKLDSLKIPINPEIQKYMLILCKDNSSFFSTIEMSLKKIIIDNKIDTKDIPEVILLVANVYEMVKTDKMIIHVNPYDIIRTILDLIFTQYIETNKVQNKDLAIELLRIVDMAIELLKLETIKPSKSCCFF